MASCSTVPQPDSTTGEKAITSTFWAMKLRIALMVKVAELLRLPTVAVPLFMTMTVFEASVSVL